MSAIDRTLFIAVSRVRRQRIAPSYDHNRAGLPCDVWQSYTSGCWRRDTLMSHYGRKFWSAGRGREGLWKEGEGKDSVRKFRKFCKYRKFRKISKFSGVWSGVDSVILERSFACSRSDTRAPDSPAIKQGVCRPAASSSQVSDLGRTQVHRARTVASIARWCPGPRLAGVTPPGHSSGSLRRADLL